VLYEVDSESMEIDCWNECLLSILCSMW
jgi:hypothetical protein